ncbi:MAG TPA: 2'-5' RNA ligase family protein [Tepidiformaceae bacterium]|nr:2'-5' RNA ligase family protein [Tepidiformaceae bacterium]
MTTRNAPSVTPSPQGRRVLVAIADGEAGERIQRWRERFDPEQARRIPPHTTLCYWVTGIDLDALDQQVRHAFPRPVDVRLRGIGEFLGTQHTFYVPLVHTETLNAARARLYDQRFVDLGQPGDWTWHITCVRDAKGLDPEVIRAAAATELTLDVEWRVGHLACLELHGSTYEVVRDWRL